MRNIIAHFDQEEKGILRQTDQIQRLLTHLRYEGKFLLGKNIRNSRHALREFQRDVKRHIRFQEKVLFPFLETHLPRYEPLIRFLHSDHRDIREGMGKLSGILSKLSRRSKTNHVETQEAGVYLICLIRNHFHLEGESIHKAIRKDLRHDERRELGRKMKRG